MVKKEIGKECNDLLNQLIPKFRNEIGGRVSGGKVSNVKETVYDSIYYILEKELKNA